MVAVIEHGFEPLGIVRQNQPLAQDRMGLGAVERPDRHSFNLLGLYPVGPTLALGLVAPALSNDLVQPAQQRLVSRIHDEHVSAPPGKTARVMPPSSSL